MNNIWELFFCPQHGLFRPDNIALLAACGQNIVVMTQLWYTRIALFVMRLYQ
jgi:hypothetical protein